MKKFTVFALLAFGGLLLLANSASALTPKIRPQPITTPVNNPPDPFVSAS